MSQISQQIYSFFNYHIHSTTAAVSGGTVAVLSPIQDWLSRAALGIVVGVGVWILTRTLSYLVKRLNELIQRH